MIPHHKMKKKEKSPYHLSGRIVDLTMYKSVVNSTPKTYQKCLFPLPCIDSRVRSINEEQIFLYIWWARFWIAKLMLARITWWKTFLWPWRQKQICARSKPFFVNLVHPQPPSQWSGAVPLAIDRTLFIDSSIKVRFPVYISWLASVVVIWFAFFG
jgi:hypothetical protein